MYGPSRPNAGVITGWPSALLAWGFCGWTALLGLILAAQGWRYVQKINDYPQIKIKGKSVSLLDDPILFSDQIGFWHPKLVVSKGLLERLNSEQLYAVLTHEQAYCYS